MKNKELTKKITQIAMLSVIVVVLALISNYITFGPVSITLALIPIVIGSIILGPTAGFILGVVNGMVVITAPSTQALFFSFSPFWTIIVCVLKTGISGLLAGLIFKVLNNKNFFIAVLLASISVPIINTGLFSVACMSVFLPLIKSLTETGANAYTFIFLTVIGFNFIIEFVVNVVLSSTIPHIVKIIKKD